MPGKPDPPPVQPSRPCGASVIEVRPVLVESAYALSEPTCNVVLRPFIGGIRKNLFCLIELNQLPQQEEARELRHPRCLLHIVRDDHNREVLLQLEDKLFNLSCRD